MNGWSVSGRTRHIEVKRYFLRELKEQGIIKIIWRSGDEMTSDIFTKNLSLSLFEYHGYDEYYYESKRKVGCAAGTVPTEISVKKRTARMLITAEAKAVKRECTLYFSASNATKSPVTKPRTEVRACTPMSHFLIRVALQNVDVLILLRHTRCDS